MAACVGGAGIVMHPSTLAKMAARYGGENPMCRALFGAGGVCHAAVFYIEKCHGLAYRPRMARMLLVNKAATHRPAGMRMSCACAA